MSIDEGWSGARRARAQDPSPKRTSRVVYVAVLLTACNSASGPVPHIAVNEDVACAECEITHRIVTTIGDDEGPGILQHSGVRVHIDDAGNVFVMVDGLPSVFRADGKFVRTIGTKGQGPGEIGRAATAIPIGRDSIMVIDPTAGRITILNELGEFGRQLKAGVFFSDAFIRNWPDSVVFVGGVRNRIRFPMHLASLRGDKIDLMASGGSMTDADIISTPERFVAHAQSGDHMWIVERPYRITEYDAALKPIRTFTRDESLLPYPNQASMGIPHIKPPIPVVQFDLAERQ